MAFDRKIWRRSDKARRSDHNGHLKRTYGITLEAYEQKLAAQNGGCAICKRKNNGTQKFFHVDHNHESGNIRGLLCRQCNTGLGSFQEIPETVIAAAHYLLGHEEAENGS
jgi:hypothetical protein